MGDNFEQEAADLDAMNNDGSDDIFEVVYRGGRLSDRNMYDIPADVNIRLRLRIDSSVTEIDEYACCYCTTLIEVVFHNHVTEIRCHAFGCCSNLQRIELPKGLLRLERDAFRYCQSLQQIVIPTTVQFVGDHVFNGCTSLESVVFVSTPNMVELGRSMFARCTNLRFVTLPHNLRSIPAWFFSYCTSLTLLQIPVSVTEIGGDAFRGSGLRSVTISENVHRIRWAAFGNCAFLERITFRSTNLNLANNIFVDCPLLSTIMIAPWLWSKLFVSMQEHPEFVFKFFRKYHTRIFDFQIVNPDVEVEGEGTLQNNIKDNNE